MPKQMAKIKTEQLHNRWLVKCLPSSCSSTVVSLVPRLFLVEEKKSEPGYEANRWWLWKRSSYQLKNLFSLLPQHT